MGRFSTFTPASRSRRGLRGLGDVASCERTLLADLANQYFYALSAVGDAASSARAPELKRAFERAYLVSSGATGSVLTFEELMWQLQAYIGEKYPALFEEIGALPLTEQAFSEWAVSAALVAPSRYLSVAQAEAAMLACTVPVATPPDTSAATAQAERDRLAREAAARAERDRIAAQAAAAAAAVATAARAEADRLAAAANTEAERAQAAAAQAEADRLANQVVTDFRLNPRLTTLLGPLDPRIAAAIRTPATSTTTSEPTNYTPWLIGGGLILAAILVSTSKTYVAQKAVSQKAVPA